MSYCRIDMTKYPYCSSGMALKTICLEHDADSGDIFEKYILCDNWNCFSSEFKAGDYVNLFPISLIVVLTSDRGDIDLPNFDVRKDVSIFHPLINFEIQDGELGDAILDMDKNKETMHTEYRYWSMKG